MGCVHTRTHTYTQITPGTAARLLRPLFFLFFFFPPYPPTHRLSSCTLVLFLCHMRVRYNRCTFQKVTPLIGDAVNIRSSETGRQKAQCLNCRLPLRDCMAYQAWSNACSYENYLQEEMWNAYVYIDDVQLIFFSITRFRILCRKFLFKC